MTTADRHTDLDPTTMDGRREHDRETSGYDATQTDERSDYTDTHEGPDHTDTHQGPDHTDTHQGPDHTDTHHRPDHTDTHHRPDHTEADQRSDYTDTHERSDYADTHERADYAETDQRRDHPEEDAQRLDAQDADTRGVSDPTLTDAAATTPAAGSEQQGTYASRHAESLDQAATATGGGTLDPAAAATGDGTPAAATSGTGDRQLERLVPSQRVQEYTARWDAVKGEFVDEPRQAVAKADALVGELLDELDQLFRKQRSDLEHGLDADETSTEDLRLAMRRYRSFFDRLLTL